MQIIVAMLIVAMHASWAYPHHESQQQYVAPRSNSLTSGVAQGYIRYLDVDGSQRLVGYSYPEPLYTVHRLSFNNQNADSTPVLKTTVQPGYIEQEYIYKDGGDTAAMREEHFRIWNLQRYQALKEEVDKLNAEGQTPSADMLGRLQEFQSMIGNTEAVYLKDTPEVRNAREQHLRIWNDAHQKQLKLDNEEAKSEIKEKTEEHLRAWNEANSKATEARVVVTAEQEKARAEHERLYNEQLLRIRKVQNDATPISSPTSNVAYEFSQSQTRTGEINSGINQAAAAESQRTKEEHAAKQLIHDAKQRVDKLAANVLSASRRYQAVQAEAQAEEAQAQKDKFIETTDKTNEQLVLAAEELREKERLREEERNRELLRARESEQFQQEQERMQTELKRLQVEDAAQLKQDLRAQYDSDRSAKGYSQVPSGVYVLSNNNQQNPFLYRSNAPGAQSSYYRIPSGKSAYAINSYLPPKHVVIPVQPSNIIPQFKSQAITYAPKREVTYENQGLSQLDRANEYHFRAHAAAIRHLEVANQDHARAYAAAVAHLDRAYDRAYKNCS